MRMRLQAKRRRRGGYTLIELLLVMLILSIAMGIFLSGMPAAVNAYMKAIDYANAQTLLATTMTRLRDELGKARNVKILGDGKEILYTNVYGNEVRIYCDESNSNAGGLFVEYRNVPSVVSSDAPEDSPAVTVLASSALASNGTAPRNLLTKYESAEFDSGGGILTISNLCVMKGTETLAAADIFLVRPLAYVK